MSEEALELKAKGNDCVRNKNYEEAVLHYTAALKLDPKNADLYSNRSLAFLRSGQHFYAFADARETIKLRPDWAKGYYRKGEVELSAGRPGEALFSYGLANRLQPNDSSISDALAKANSAFDKLKRREQVPWLCAGVGIVLGVAIVLADQLMAANPSISHPLLMALLTMAIATIAYGLGRAWKYHAECQTKSLLEPPVDLLTEMNGTTQDDSEILSNGHTEKPHIRLTKAQARAKFRKGKT